MSILYGEEIPKERLCSSLYEVFQEMVLKGDGGEKIAFITQNGAVTLKDLNTMIDSLANWLHKKVKHFCTSYFSWKCKENLSAPNISSKCVLRLWKTLKEKNKEHLDTGSLRENLNIAICLNRGPELVALVLAIWKLHLSFVPLDPLTPLIRTSQVLKESDPFLLIGDRHTIQGLNEVIQNISSKNDSRQGEREKCGKTIYEDTVEQEIKAEDEWASLESRIIDLEDWKLSFHESTSDSQVDYDLDPCFSNLNAKYMFKAISCSCKDNLACVIYTSGSTGIPKGVRIKTQNFVNRLTWQWKAYPFGPKDVCIWSKSYTFIDSYTELLCPLLAGIPLVIVGELVINPEIISKYVSTYDISRLVCVPSFLKLLIMFLNTDKALVKIFKRSIKLWISSGEPLPNWLLRDFYDMFPDARIANFYGSTEVSGDVSHCLLSKEMLEGCKEIPLGVPISNTALFVFEREGNTMKVLPEGDVGEIGVVGLNVCDGYLNAKSTKEQEQCFYTLGSFCFSEREDVKNLHDYLNDVGYFTGERYGIMEQTFCASTRNTQQSFLKYTQSSGFESLRKCFIQDGNFLDLGTKGFPENNLRKKSRAASICAGGPLTSCGSHIVADEIELLNKFKGIKSFAEAGAVMPHDHSLRRASMPSAGDLTRGELPDKKNFPHKFKFKPNIKTTAELTTTEISKMSLSTTGIKGSVSDSSQDNPFFQMPLVSHPIQQFTSMAPVLNKSPDIVVSSNTPSSTSIAAIYPSVTASVSQTFYILKQISTLTKEKLAVYATGDLGKIEDGILYYQGRKDCQIKVKGIRLDPTEIETALRSSNLVENQYLMTIQDEDYEDGGGIQNNEKNETMSSKNFEEYSKTSGTSYSSKNSKLSPKASPLRKSPRRKSSPIYLSSLVAFIVLKKKNKTKEVDCSEKLLLHLRRQLPEAMVPQLVVMDELPLLPSGKVDSEELLRCHRTRGKENLKKDVLIMVKEEPIEMRVLRIICNAVGLPLSQELLQKNFFSIGGTSISSVVAVIRLKEMGYTVSLEKFLRAPSLSHVVHDILKAKTRAEVMHLFAPSPTRRSEEEEEEEEEVEDEEGGREKEEKDGYATEEEEKNEVEWMKGSEEDGTSGSARLLSLHPDLPALLVGGEVETRIGAASAKIKGSKTRLRIARLCTAPLPANEPEKKMTIELIAGSFTNRNPLDLALGVQKESHQELMENLWPFLLQQDLSFVVCDRHKGIVGAMITTDFFHEPEVEIPTQMVPIIAVHNLLESKVRKEIEKEEGKRYKWAHNVFLATSSAIEPQDNVRLSLHLEKELLKLAVKKRLRGVFTINSNPSNQLLCSHYLGYELRASLPVHSFEMGGKTPFGGASKDLSLIAMVKKL